MESDEIGENRDVCSDSMFLTSVHSKEWSPLKCAVRSCQNTETVYTTSNLSYLLHDFPENASTALTWKKKCGIPDDTDVSTLKVCSDHFSSEDYATVQGDSIPDLKPAAVPHRNVKQNILDVKFSMVKQIVDENKLLTAKRSELQNKQIELQNEIITFEKRIKSLDGVTVSVRNKLRKLKERASKVKQDKDLMSQVFSEAQINILLGQKKVRWSNDDLARAFTLRHMGGRECYSYLKDTLNFPLPSLSCVQKWASSNN